ncbi:MipA/OmpV family protein [Paracoccus aestuariivivens]|nr:MipA/OmpV family protein [Paracoccus aestuariivivens]
MNLARVRFCGLALICLTAATGAGAQENRGLGLGLGYFSGERAYGDTDNVLVPLVDFETDWVRFRGLTADLKLPFISSETLSFAIRANYTIGEGYEADDTPVLAGMDERKGGLWAGAAMDWRPGFADFAFEWQSDISGDSDGHRLRVEMSRRFNPTGSERFGLTPRITGIWMDDNAAEYYYGVRTTEVTPTRTAYTGSSTLNVELGVQADYMLSERQILIFDAGVTRLGSGITDSPITVDKTLTSVGMGYAYRF